MTDESAPAPDDPHDLLTVVRDLTRQVRITQRVTWFPLLVFAAITLAVIPIYRFAPHHLGPCRPVPQGGANCTAFIPSVLVYWPIALVLAYTAIAGFYVNRSRQRGVGTPIRPYVVVGIAIAVLLAAVSLWRALHPLVPPDTPHLHLTPYTLVVYGLITPVTAIGLALLVLAWVERNPALLAFSLAYMIIVTVDGARIVHSTSQWYFLPQLLIPASVLLLGSAGFAVFPHVTVRRPR